MNGYFWGLLRFNGQTKKDENCKAFRCQGIYWDLIHAMNLIEVENLFKILLPIIIIFEGYI